MKQVDISVLITNYNHKRYLPECLEAVYSQSAQPREIILIDDASTDGSISWILDFQKRHPDLIFLQSALNQGPAKAMNRAIKHAKGKYLILAAADDRMLPGFFEKGAYLLEQYSDAAICCSDASFFYELNDKHFQIPISKSREAIYLFPHEIRKQYLHGPLWIPTNASIYKRDVVIACGCLDDDLKHLCDWYLNCKIALQHGIVYAPETFGAFRLSPQSYGAIWNRSFRKKMLLYRNLFSKLNTEREALQNLFLKSGVFGLIASDVLIYLLLHVNLWKFFPRALYRKTWNFFRKIQRNFKNKT